MTGTDVLVTGAGAVGGYAVEFLARRPEVRSIVILDRDGDRATGVAWRATLGALQEGKHVSINGVAVDLADRDATAEVIARFAPRVIFHAATLITVPEMARGLPPDDFARVRASGMAGFLAAHLVLGLSVQAAIAETSLNTSLITAPFPDFANQVLARTGHAPLTGIGNVDNMAAELQAAVARKLGISALSVQPLIVAHHSVAEWFQRSGSAGAAPWHARVSVDGVDISEQLDLDGLMAESSARIRPVPQESRTAASGVKAVLAALRDDGTFLHGAGPAGLPGGWPIRLWADRVEVLPVPGIDRQAGIETALAGQRKGGIEQIEEDGTLIATETCAAMMSDLFGVDVSRITPAEIPETAMALRRALSARIAA
ncbi:NAD-dependent epimerase/dehydratase family protein [Pelagovum pacificum]|uniref:NAD-dependent epimerase/dehydratase family protein n=1 Tax=Pelagovum pacificum TaxID=2588711 RepID=A0A5C5G922_9RHOB|nr:NAD-dependent epimerase/dehydratase family protein [Pelagovum pacificum]QQA41974.1 NAD-dependent epimerase/dehydratase family protein [Pelagovum pacificum]TNY30585.1 NAD-dependent epimerase/dehydratase family protein [Pelagovum pacificum]